MKTSSYIYIIGSACILLADLLSDEENMSKLRSKEFRKVLKRLQEIEPALRATGSVSLSASIVSGECEKYVKRVSKKGIDKISPEELKGLYAEIAQSSSYLESWLTVFERVPPEMEERLDELFENAIQQVVREWSAQKIAKEVLDE